MDLTHEQTTLLTSAMIAVAVFLAGVWIGPFWDALARKQVDDLTPIMDQLNLDQSKLPTYMRWWGIAMIAVAFLVALVIRAPLLTPFFLYLVFVSPRLYLESEIRRRRTLLRDQMVGASVTLANSARAGLTLAQGLEGLSKEAPEPIASEFRRLVREYQRGRPLPEAIRDAKDRLNLDGFTLFASAILTCLERGGRVTDALERISASLQENQRLERKLEADTASGRKVILILGAFPLLFLAFFFLMDPELVRLLFHTIIGQIVLLAIGLLVYGSVRWAQRIVTLEI